MPVRKHLIWGKEEAEYFSARDWTTQISLMRLDNFAFSREGARIGRSRPARG
jgi:hypothetical protein